MALDCLWKEYPTDPSRWWDRGGAKIKADFLDSQHKVTNDSLWFHGCELSRKGSLVLSENAVDADGLVRRKKKSKTKKQKANGINGSSEEDEGFLMVNNGNCEAYTTAGPVALVALLKACAHQNDLCEGSKIHAVIIERGLLERDLYVGSTLVHMYAKCGELVKAQEVFDELPLRDSVSWTALISGYAQHGHGEEAINIYEQMQVEGLSPNAVTFASILKAFGSIEALAKGQEVHTEMVRQGLLANDVVIGTALVDMYAKCGALTKAQKTFDVLPTRNVISWNALVGGYAQHGLGEQAINCFERMQLEGPSPNVVTFACILKACGSIGASQKGQEVHAVVARLGLLEKDVMLGTALVDMYAKCDELAKAQKMFDELPVRNAISWNAVIAGYAQNGYSAKAIKCYDQMQLEGLSPNTVTFASILKACGSIGATSRGQEIHVKISREGLMEKDLVVGNALVDMYAKCGALANAQEVFDELPVQDIVVWNALLAGYSQLGKDAIVYILFSKMLEEGIEPDLITFAILLNGCSHSGRLDKGQLYFETMSNSYGIIPTLEHHSCMVDLFSRAGHLDKAMAVIKEMPYYADPSMWHIVLGACRKWGDVKCGRLAFEHAVQLDEKDVEAYVCMSNIYMQLLECKGMQTRLKL